MLTDALIVWKTKSRIVLFANYERICFFRHKWHCFWQNTIPLVKRRRFFLFGCIVWTEFFLNSIFRQIPSPYGVGVFVRVCFCWIFFYHSFEQRIFTRRSWFRMWKTISDCRIAKPNMKWICIWAHIYEQYLEGPSKFLTAPDIHNSTSSVSHVRVFRC